MAVTPPDELVMGSIEFEPKRDRTVLHFSYELPKVLNYVLATRENQYQLAHTVLNKLTDAIVADVLASAAVQARIAQIRAELPVRIETAVAQAITAAVLKPLAPVQESDNGD